MAIVRENKSLEDNLKDIQGFTDKQLSFYRDNESYKYDELLEIINFIKQNDFDTLNHTFYLSKDYIKDFKELFESFVNYEEYDRSSSKKSNFHKTIEKLTKIIEKRNTQDKEEKQIFAKTLQEYESKFKKMEETLHNYQETSKLLHQELKEKNNQINNIAIKAQNIETAFSEKINLHEAKEYWNKKSKKHTINALTTVIMFLIIIFSISLITYDRIETSKNFDIQGAPTKIIIDKNITVTPNTSQEKSYEDRIKRHEIIRYIQYLFLLSLFIWISRILLKITFSNLHLREEAHEKETMIMTYLALIHEGGGLETNDRQLILEAIFRPSTNGLIKDESNLTILDVIKSIKS